MPNLPDTPAAGLAIATAAFLIAPGMDVFAKLLTATQSPAMIVIGRFVVANVLLAGLIMAVEGWSRPRAAHAAAGICLGLALVLINSAFVVMPIANALAIFFVEPLILTALSALILRETIGWRRITAVIVGLIGAMIVIRPNWEAYGLTALMPLGTAVCFAGYLLITRTLTVKGRRLGLQFWTGMWAIAVMIAFIGIGSATGMDATAVVLPDMGEAWLFLWMGILAVITHQMIAVALSRIGASILAPMQYLEIVSATLFGWWVFADLPDGLTLLGAGVIIGSGVYVFWRERTVRGT